MNKWFIFFLAFNVYLFSPSSLRASTRRKKINKGFSKDEKKVINRNTKRLDNLIKYQDDLHSYLLKQY